MAHFADEYSANATVFFSTAGWFASSASTTGFANSYDTTTYFLFFSILKFKEIDLSVTNPSEYCVQHSFRFHSQLPSHTLST